MSASACTVSARKVTRTCSPCSRRPSSTSGAWTHNFTGTGSRRATTSRATSRPSRLSASGSSGIRPVEATMPVEWSYGGDVIRLGGAGRYRIAAEDAARQEQTAGAILEALKGQPGIILADEVGMGKTY